MSKHYIYCFFNKANECIYVGKTIHLKPRFNQHKKDKSWWDEVVRIEYAECEKGFMIDLYEATEDVVESQKWIELISCNIDLCFYEIIICSSLRSVAWDY